MKNYSKHKNGAYHKNIIQKYYNNYLSNVKSLLFLLVLVFSLNSCSRDISSKTNSEQNKSNPVSVHKIIDTLNVLIWDGYAPKKFVSAFEEKIEKKYDRKVKLNVMTATSSDDFYNKVRDKSVDLITPSHHSIKDERFDFITKKLLLPIDLENIPNYKNLIQDYKKAEFCTENNEVYGIPIANGPYGLGYNSELITPPGSWKIFWDDNYKKRYSLGLHEYLYNVNLTALALGYPKESISSYDALNNDIFKKKLRQLAVNAKSFWIGVDYADDLKGLDFAASWGDSFSELKRQGELWKMANPKEGTLWWIDVYALSWALADQPFMKKVAEEWINEVLSTDFQIENLVREVQIYPVITNIENMLTHKEKLTLLTNSPESVVGSKILQQTYSQRDRNGLKLMWDEALKGISIEKGKDK